MNVRPQWNHAVRRKEPRLSVRAVRRLLSVVIYVTAISVLAMVYLSMTGTGSGMVSGEDTLSSQARSRELFIFLSGAQLMVIALLAPGFTAAGAVNRTAGLGTWTGLRSRLASSIRYMMQLVLSTAPLYVFLYVMGGMAFIRLIIVLLYYMLVLLILGCFGVYYSTVFKRTVVSVIFSYGTAFVMFAGTGLAAVYLGTAIYPNGGWGTGLALGLNPMAVLISLLNPDFSEEAFGSQSLMQLWYVFLPVYSLLCAALLGLSARYHRA